MYALFSGSYMYMPATLMDWCNFLDYVLIFICKFISRVTLFFSSYVYIKKSLSLSLSFIVIVIDNPSLMSQ